MNKRSPHKLTREERETIIRCSAADQEWDVCTADPRIIRYLIRQRYVPEPDQQLSEPYVVFTVQFSRLRFLKREKRRPAERPFASHSHREEAVCDR